MFISYNIFPDYSVVVINYTTRNEVLEELSSTKRFFISFIRISEYIHEYFVILLTCFCSKQCLKAVRYTLESFFYMIATGRKDPNDTNLRKQCIM